MARIMRRQPEQPRLSPGARSSKQHPDSPGSLGTVAISRNPGRSRGQETRHQICAGAPCSTTCSCIRPSSASRRSSRWAADAYPDVVIGCAGGGSNFAGLSLSVSSAISFAATRGEVRVIAVEPAACPSLTRSTYAFDFGEHRSSDAARHGDAHPGSRFHSARLPRRGPPLSRHGPTGQRIARNWG